MSPLTVSDLGCDVDYRAALARQEVLHAERVAGCIPDTLLLLEHRRVYTLGRSAEAANLLRSVRELAGAGIDVCATTRGGDVTYHGPGQLVGYPILHLGERGLRVIAYVTALEEVLIRVLAGFGLQAGRDARNRGVWVGDDKIAALGIRVSRQVAMHGFALNVNTRLSDYAGLVPCGLRDAGVTSLARLLGHAIPMEEVKSLVVREFRAVMGYG
jgi:lipoate-protein ligase B